MKRTILIVEAQKSDREEWQRILGEQYLFLQAGDGQEALSILLREDSGVSAVLLNISAASTSGYEMLEGMQRSDRLARVPVLALTEAEDVEARALALGAVSCLRKPIRPDDRLRASLQNILRLCETAATVQIYQRDKLTGLFNREAFFAEAEQMIRSHKAGFYVLSCFNIESFKVVNDQYGEKTGDEVLKHVGRCFDEYAKILGGICCRYTADKFAALYPAAYMYSESLLQCHKDTEAPTCVNQRIRIRIGRCVVDNLTLPVGSLYDRAMMAEETIRGRYDVYIAEYQESMRDQMLHEQKIVSEMYGALRSGQFETWFQPQYNHVTGALIGAEALVRWRHPEDGQLIPPGKFIPAFERNGFIYELDQYIWEQVCRHLRRRLDGGCNPLPISVNVSRRDLLMDNCIQVLTGLLGKYDIPVELLRLEITESAFSQSPDQIVSTIKKLIALGFTVEIDDFGSGYSSLNTLKDIPAHIIKLDMKFLENAEDSARGGNILESVVCMAKWLDMAVIAEGVETKEQADYLKSIGCFYVQGYLYAKPMPLEGYETLEAGAKKEPWLEALKTVKNLGTSPFWDPKNMDAIIFNSYLGGACVLEVFNKRMQVLRANDKYMRVISSTGMTTADALKLDWSAYMDKESRHRFFDALQESVETGEENDAEYLFYHLPGCGEKTYLRVNVRVIDTNRNRLLVYCLIENTTVLRLAEEKEREIKHKRQAEADQLRAIMDNINRCVTAATIVDGTPNVLFANEWFYQITGYTREQYRAELKDAYDFIHPDDRAKVNEAVNTTNNTHQALSLSYRIVRRDKTVRWMRGNLSMITLPGMQSPVQIRVANDITEQRLLEQRERETAALLQAILDNINGGISAVTFLENGGVRYIFANNEYYAMLGYTKEQFQNELPCGILDLIHPDDLPMVYAVADENLKRGKPARIEYRVRRRDGSEIWVHSSCLVCQIDSVGAPVLISSTVDVTDQKEAAEHFRFLNEMAHEILVQPDIKTGIEGLLLRLLAFFDSGRVTIFEYDHNKCVFSNTYEACAPGVTSERGNLQEIPIDATSFWRHALETQDYIEIPDVEALPDGVRGKELLQAQGIHSLVAVSLRRDGRLIGFVGMGDTRRNHRHIGRLAVLGDYIAMMLTRRDYEARLAGHVRFQEQMMRDMPGGYVKMQLVQTRPVPVFMNDEFCRLCGMTYQQAMAIYGEDAFAGVHPDDRDMARKALEKAVTNTSTALLRLRFKRGDGGYAPLQVFYRVTNDSDGKLYLSGYYSDAMEPDKAEQQRRELLDNLPEGAALYAYDGKTLSVIHLNKRYWQLVGRAPVKYEDEAFLRTVHPEDRSGILQELDAAIRQKRDFSCNARIRYGEDGYRPFHLSARITEQSAGKYLFYVAYMLIPDWDMVCHEMLPAALSAIMSASSDYAFVKDGNMRYVCASLAAAKWMGMESEAALIGKTNYDIMEKDRADEYTEYDQQVLQTGEPVVGLEERSPSASAPSRWSVVSKYPLRSLEGRTIGLLGIGRDVTEIHDAAFELKTLLTVIPSGIFKYSGDEKEEFAYINHSLVECLGYTEEQFREKFHNSFREMIYVEDRERAEREVYQQEQNGRVGKLEYRIEAADGRLRWFHNEGVRVTDQEGKSWYYVAVLDITERREADARLRLLTNGVSGGLGSFEYGPQGIRQIYINDGFFRLLGYTREEYAELIANDQLALVFEEDRKTVREAFVSVGKQTGQSATCTYRCHTKGGGYCWFSLSTSITERHGDTLVFSVVLYDITEQKNVERQLRMSEEEYRLATLHSNVSIGRYSIADQTLSIAPRTIKHDGFPVVLENIPNSVVKNGEISPDTIPAYMNFYTRIMHGEKEGAAKYQRKINGRWNWVEAHFSTLFSDDGKPVSAIVSFREITEQIEKEAIYKKWMQSVRDRPESSYTLVQCNLNKNTVFDSVEGSLLGPMATLPVAASFSEWLQEYAKFYVYVDDHERYMTSLSIDALCDGYYKGKHTIVLEYREVVPENDVRWLRLTVELLEYPSSADIVAYMLYENIDERKREELHTQRLAEKDPLTGLLNRTVFQEKVTSRIEQRKDTCSCALFLLDVDGFKLVNDKLGHIAGDRMLIRIGQKLRSILREEDLICRLGGDEFMVFLCNTHSREDIKKKAEQICTLLQKSIGPKEKITVSLGIAVVPDDGNTFKILYQKVDLALYHVKATGKNHCAFYEENMATARHVRQGEQNASAALSASERDKENKENP